MTVYECINSVSSEIAVSGIAKTHSNSVQGYQFRGIDDVYNALAPMLAKHKLVIMPRIVARSQTEKATRTGGVIFYVVVEAEFDFVSCDDGTHHTVKTFGEAMDTADKATNKAMSAAYKYAAFQTFCIPTEGDNDADQSTLEPMTPAIAAVKPSIIKKQYQNADGSTKAYPSTAGDHRPISEPQIKRMFAIAKQNDVAVNDIKMKLALEGVESSSDIQRQNYDALIKWIEAGGVKAESTDFIASDEDVAF